MSVSALWLVGSVCNGQWSGESCVQCLISGFRFSDNTGSNKLENLSTIKSLRVLRVLRCGQIATMIAGIE